MIATTFKMRIIIITINYQLQLKILKIYKRINTSYIFKKLCHQIFKFINKITLKFQRIKLQIYILKNLIIKSNQ